MPAEIRKRLEEAGFGDTATLVHAADWGDIPDIESMAAQIGIEGEYIQEFLEKMPSLALAAAEGPARRAADKTAAVPICDVVVAAELRKRRREQERVVADPKKFKLADLGAPKNALRIRWPTRLRRAMDLEGDPNARQEAEMKERARWVS